MSARPRPILMILDERDAPRLVILTRCSACQHVFVRRLIHVAIDDSVEEKAARYAAQDWERWIEHLAAYHNEKPS